jgi:hypothetical protein
MLSSYMPFFYSYLGACIKVNKTVDLSCRFAMERIAALKNTSRANVVNWI